MKNYYLNNLIGNPLDTTIAAACLVFGGVIERYPKHQRFYSCTAAASRRIRPAAGRTARTSVPNRRSIWKKPPAETIRTFYWDTILHSKPQLEFLVQEFGAAHVILGSDYPYDMGTFECARQVKALSCGEMEKLTVAQRIGAEALGGREIMSAAPVAASAIAALIKDAMMAVGVPDADAAKIAELMLEADLTGADAHGVFRLPQYIRRIKAGGVNPRPNITVEQTAPATAMVDGDNGMGHLVMQRAADTAIALAKGKRGGRGLARGAAITRRGRHLRGDGAAARHDRNLLCGRQRQSHAGLGRGRKPVEHKSDCDCGAGRRRAAGRARHRHHGRVLRDGEAPTSSRASRCRRAG